MLEKIALRGKNEIKKLKSINDEENKHDFRIGFNGTEKMQLFTQRS